MLKQVELKIEQDVEMSEVEDNIFYDAEEAASPEPEPVPVPIRVPVSVPVAPISSPTFGPAKEVSCLR